MPQLVPPPHAEAPSKPSGRPADATTPDPGSATPKPAEEGAIFRALLDAGAEAMVAYTAEKRLYTMVSEAVAPQLEPFLAEMRRRFDQLDRRFDQVDQRLDQVDRHLDQHDRRFDQLDRRVDALAAAGVERDRRLDVLVAQMRILMGGFALLVTILIAVFGFLFTD